MLARLKPLLALDLDQVSLRRGLFGLVGVFVAIVFVAVFGTAGMTAGLAVLFVIAADSPGAPRERVGGVVVMTVVGAVVTVVATWAGTDHVWLATLLTAGIALLATLAAGFGSTWAARGVLLALWAVVALSVAGAGQSALELGAAYVLGGILAAVILWLKERSGDESAEQPTSDEAAVPDLAAIIRSPLGLFALLRAGAVGLATVLGIELFPDHAIWAALTVLLVLSPNPGDSLETVVLRTLGTLAGGLAGVAVVALAGGSDAVVIVAFCLAAFAMMALKDV
ncbi:MAG: FUSC family protein, partial [Miltoncostaeaceae bacterium]